MEVVEELRGLSLDFQLENSGLECRGFAFPLFMYELFMDKLSTPKPKLPGIDTEWVGA